MTSRMTFRTVVGVFAVVLGASPVAAFAAPAAAAVTCPVVNPQTGAPTPAPSAGVDWSGCDLRGASITQGSLANSDLSNADLSNVVIAGLDLTGANLANANLTSAGIASANLTTALLNSANLTNAVLNAVNVTGTSVQAATLSGIRSRSLTGQPATLPSGWQVVSGFLAGPGADLVSSDFIGADLAGADLAGADMASATLTGANLSGADLTDTDLQRAKLSNADVSNADLASANASGATLSGIDVAKATFTGATLVGAPSGAITGVPASLPVDWSLVGGYLMGPGADLNDADLSTLNLGLADLNSASVTGADLDQTDMASADLTNINSGAVTGKPVLPAHWTVSSGYLIGPTADLQGGNLTGADLAVADLDSANLGQADLASANLTQADLANADLTDANASSADLSGTVMAHTLLSGVQSADLTGAPASLPASWSVDDGYLVGPAANLTDAQLAGLKLPGADLASTQFQGADLSGADLAGADLNQATFGGADLSSADLAGANLNSAFLSGANLTGADAVGVQMQADLESANLTQADLANANLGSANVTGLIMSGTNLSGANLNQVLFFLPGSGTPKALPANWTAADGFLIGPTVAIDDTLMTGIDLHGDDLAGAVLDNDNLTGADLDHADLAHADLVMSTMTGVSVVGTIWLDTVCPDFSNSNKHIDGCLSGLDTTPPVVAITGVSNGKSYVVGRVPAARCVTTDNGTVATPAALTTTTTGKHGVGRFTATCSGAVDLAGNKQLASVRASYSVLYGMHGFASPASGAKLRRSAGRISVSFRLTNGAGTPIARSLAAALAHARDVRVALTAHGMRRVAATCTWSSAARLFKCSLRLPAAIATGRISKAMLTATENVGTGLVVVPAIKGSHDPQTVRFR